MVTVIVSKHGSIEKALRVFEIKCRKARVYQTVRQKSYFISKSEKRHRRKTRRNRT